VAVETRRVEEESYSQDVSELALRINAERVLLELSQIYSRREDAVRELVQNAVDSGASEIRIRFERRDDGTHLIFEHNGAPIEGEDLEAFLVVGTDHKARSPGKYVGRFGIGRLAVFMLTDEAVIESGWNRFTWRKSNIGSIIAERMPYRVDGVRWDLKMTQEVDPEDLARYLRDNYWGRVPVYIQFVDSQGISHAVRAGWDPKKMKLLTKVDDHTSVYMYEDDSPGGVVYMGFRVGYFARSLIVVTDDPSLTISTQRTLLWDDKYVEWRERVSRAILEAIREKFDPEEADRKFGLDLLDLVEYAFPGVNNSLWNPDPKKKAETFREANRFLPYYNSTTRRCVWGDELDPSRHLYTTEELTDTSKERLLARGKEVIRPRLQTRWVLDILKFLGFKDASEEIMIDEVKELNLKEISDAFAEVAMSVESIAEEVFKEILPGATDAGSLQYSKSIVKANIVRVSTTAGEAELELRESSSDKVRLGDVEAKVLGSVSGSGIRVAVVEAPPEVVAFTDRRSIYVNVRNPMMAELLKLRKEVDPDLWRMAVFHVILHEYLHILGYDHSDQHWTSLYERMLLKYNLKVLKERAEREPRRASEGETGAQ